ncbi:LLM class flavin-dependent oxidoreductase [Pseudonocardia adelaidensis]|uniref:LLM class flavin-dependent oxidoreductase n=1 Tax=Pseudonocardia adelaidensis TaxID=648754 RepID=A0ABP9NSL4_9PSEU
MDLEFGLFDWVDAVPGTSVAQVYDARLRILAEADTGGFATYHLAEHHGTPLGLAPSPAVFVAAAARVTERIRLAPTTFVVPLYEPLRLAEEIAMLDQLSHGRLDVGVGKGSSPYELAMYGLDPAGAAGRFESAVPAVLDALETGRFGDVELSVPVYQRPHPPLWYPTSNPASIPRLGDQGYNVLFGFGFVSPPLDVVREQSRTFFARFRASEARGAARCSLPGRPPRFGVMRHVLVAPSDDEARALAKAAFADHYASFAHLWRAHGDDRFSTAPDLDELVEDHKLFAGSPQTVAAQVAEAVTVGELNYLACAFAWGSLEVDAVLRSLRLFRDDVVPAVS